MDVDRDDDTVRLFWMNMCLDLCVGSMVNIGVMNNC